MTTELTYRDSLWHLYPTAGTGDILMPSCLIWPYLPTPVVGAMALWVSIGRCWPDGCFSN